MEEESYNPRILRLAVILMVMVYIQLIIGNIICAMPRRAWQYQIFRRWAGLFFQPLTRPWLNPHQCLALRK